MKAILLGMAILFGSASFAQDVKPTLSQCEKDSSSWVSEFNSGTGFKVLKTLTFNDLVDRAHEMDVCRFEVVPKFDLEKTLADRCWGNGHTGCTEKQIVDIDMEDDLYLEDWINYERLAWGYWQEANYRATIFIRTNNLDERFWQFNSGYTKANQ